jgi:glutamate-1-semialdehyde 2,1-aminomutase
MTEDAEADVGGLAVSGALFERAQQVLPGGNTRTTIFHRPHPPYAVRAAGAWVWDADGFRRLDVNNNYTALIHGHGRPEVISAVQAQAERLLCVSMPTELEIELAERIAARSPAIDRVRFTNSGSEAVMLAVKAARAFTGRPLVAKAEGAYHGSYDVVEVSLDSRPDTWGEGDPARVPYCAGTPSSVLDGALVFPFNEPEATLRLLEAAADDLAAVIVDPAPTRMGLIGAEPGFLAALRAFCDRTGCLLIFDEVISYRFAFGGAHVGLGVRPDLVTMGKLIGGGLPVGAVGGQAEAMSVFEARNARPRVPHGGTFNANPMTMTAGCVALDLWDAAAVASLNRLGAQTEVLLSGILRRHNVDGEIVRQGSLLRTTLNTRPKRTYRGSYPDGPQAIREGALFHALLERGVLIGQNLIVALSTAMGDGEVAYLAERYDDAVRAALA